MCRYLGAGIGAKVFRRSPQVGCINQSIFLVIGKIWPSTSFVISSLHVHAWDLIELCCALFPHPSFGQVLGRHAGSKVTHYYEWNLSLNIIGDPT